MKINKIKIAAAVAGLMLAAATSQAQLTEYYTGQSGGNPAAGAPVLQVISTVTGSYNYSYTFTLGYGTGASFTPETSANALYLFTVTLLDTSDITAISGGGTLGGDTIYWSLAGVYTGTVSYDSPNPPGIFDAAAQDGSVNWTGITQVPAAVPEASTIIAGALMILPLGIGAFRSVRKERIA